SSVNRNISLYTTEDLIAWLTELKCKYDLQINRIPLKSLQDWAIKEDRIEHKDQKYFSVIATNITISNREVSSWTQPLVEPAQEGLIAFIVKEIYGVLHFLVQAKLECGNFDILELAPTVQTLTGDYKNPDYEVPFLKSILNAPKSNIWFDTKQSEEGGRFYREQNRNIIVEVGDEFSNKIPENYRWMTLNQLNDFIKFNNYLNIQARSILSAISFI
ncbi:MAG: NDP-hexose 2,3-dehydratase family protein, partial [Bacteroidales bacterium]|nr:NDP-hexose 2,3-dehydratase family protein [Bacteroidales bacterium]